MAENMVRKMLLEAQAEGWTFVVDGGGDEPDYVGNDALEALDAIEAVEEAELTMVHDECEDEWAMIVNGLDENERIVDCACGGFIENWTEVNCFD